jgi:hypothetical protein
VRDAGDGGGGGGFTRALTDAGAGEAAVGTFAAGGIKVDFMAGRGIGFFAAGFRMRAIDRAEAWDGDGFSTLGVPERGGVTRFALAIARRAGGLRRRTRFALPRPGGLRTMR